MLFHFNEFTILNCSELPNSNYLKIAAEPRMFLTQMAVGRTWAITREIEFVPERVGKKYLMNANRRGLCNEF